MHCTFQAALATAEEESAASVALPAIGCGVLGWEPSTVARVAANVVAEVGWRKGDVKRIDFVMPSSAFWRTWRKVFEEELGVADMVVEGEDFATWRLNI